MVPSMNYAKHYDVLIDRAQHRVVVGYTERHHVKPRCMGGDDSIKNIVRLTPEEHFVAHLLLTKIHPGVRGLVYAAYAMTFGSRQVKGRSGNKAAGWLRRRIAEVKSSPEVRLAHSDRAKNDPRVREALLKAQQARIGTSHSDDTKARLSAAHKTSKAAAHARAAVQKAKIGVPRSAETRIKIGDGHRGKKHTDSHRAAIASALKGKPKSAEHNAKVSAAHMGKPGTRRGAVTSEATKQKQREAALRRYHPERDVSSTSVVSQPQP